MTIVKRYDNFPASSHPANRGDKNGETLHMKTKLLSAFVAAGLAMLLAGCTTSGVISLGNADIYNGVTRHMSAAGGPGVSIAAAQACEKLGPEMVERLCREPEVRMFGGPSALSEVAAPVGGVIAELVHKPDNYNISATGGTNTANGGDAKAEGGTGYGGEGGAGGNASSVSSSDASASAKAKSYVKNKVDVKYVPTPPSKPDKPPHHDDGGDSGHSGGGCGKPGKPACGGGGGGGGGW